MILIKIILLIATIINVCLCQGFNIWDPLAPTSSVNIDFSDDAFLTTDQLLDKNGYTNENHYATTPDGYVIELHRIRGRKGSANIPDTATTILMMPGLCVADNAFVINGPRSLAPAVADEGFDVWLGNWRGSRYARNHTSLSVDDPQFWKFDIYEQSVIDIPAIIDYILEYVNKPKLHYLGLSLGGISINYLLGLKPEYNSKIKALFYVTASMSFKHTKSIPMRTSGIILKPIAPLLPHISIPVFGYSREGAEMMYNLLRNPLLLNLSYRFFAAIFGPYSDAYNVSRHALYLNLQSSGCPIGIGMESTQAVFFKEFQLYDAGIFGNQAKYGTKYPPVINMSLITPPKVIFYGSNDYIVTQQDALWTASTMSDVRKIIELEGHSHLAPLLNDDSKVKFIDPLLEQLRLLD